MDEQKSFQERHRDALAEEAGRIQRRDTAVADIVRSTARIRVGQVVAIEDGDGVAGGAFVVQMEHGGATVWMAVNDGKRLTMAFHTRALAVLHLLSVRYGDGDQMGASALFAGRVLGITDEPSEEG